MSVTGKERWEHLMQRSIEVSMEDACPHCEKQSLLGRKAIDSVLLTVVLCIRCAACPFKAVTRSEDLMDVSFLYGPDGVKEIYDDLYTEWLRDRIHGMHPLQALGDMA